MAFLIVSLFSTIVSIVAGSNITTLQPGFNNSTEYPNTLGINSETLSPTEIQINITENSEQQATNIKDVGHWAVYDTAEIVTRNQDNPCCLLASMKAKVSIKLKSRQETIFSIPVSARSFNDTCMNKGFGKQRLNLTWASGNKDLLKDVGDEIDQLAVFSLSFDTKSHYSGNGSNPWAIVPGAHFLSGIFFDVPVNMSTEVAKELALDKNPNNTTYGKLGFHVVTDVRRLHLFQAPKLYAYCCEKRKIELHLPASIQTIDRSQIVEVEAVLTMINLQLEPFRKERFYTDFTHLKWDCVKGWQFHNIVEVVNGALGCFVVIIIIAMTFGAKRQREKLEVQYGNLEESFDEDGASSQ